MEAAANIEARSSVKHATFQFSSPTGGMRSDSLEDKGRSREGFFLGMREH